MFSFKFMSLTYICFVYSSFLNDDEQYHLYRTELNVQPLFEDYCELQPRTLATYCLHAFRRLANISKDYESLYLDFIYFERAQAIYKNLKTNLCENTKLMVRNGDKLLNVPMKHMICRRGPVIVRTDEPNENKYYDDISIYISARMKFIILQRIDRENHILLAKFLSTVFRVKLIGQPIKTPLSTFTMEKIEEQILKGPPEKHILEKEVGQVFLFKKICYMIFSRPEYKGAVKFLPSNEIRRNLKRGSVNFEFLYIFANMTKLLVELHTCNILEENYMFWLMKGSDENSVIVVGYLDVFEIFTPYELVENITSEYLEYQIEFPN